MKILLQNSPFKFMNNFLFLDNKDLIVDLFNNESDLYKNYFLVKPDAVILSAHHITQKIIQFIEDMHSSTKIYIYHYSSQYISKIISDLSRFDIKHIIHSDYDSDQTITIPKNLINSKIFNNDIKIEKTNKIVCFLDGLKNIPENILPFLYPSKKMPIQLFNNPIIKHVQNLGLLTEYNKSILLKNNKYYLNCEAINDYSNEAIACGCCVIKPEQLSNYLSVECESSDYNYISYTQFLMDSFI